jgi:hypothetical protein
MKLERTFPNLSTEAMYARRDWVKYKFAAGGSKCDLRKKT